MKISAGKDNLLYGVQVVQRAVSAKNPLPILSGILLHAENGRLTLSATDLELGIECAVSVTVLDEGGVVLPSKYISEIVRKLPDVNIHIDSNPQNNSTQIKYGKSEFNLLGLPAEDFPILPSVESDSVLTLRQDIFKQMIRQVGFATSTDENRPIFTGVLMEAENGTIKLVATDTHRLAFKSESLEVSENHAVKAVIIPGKTLNELNRILSGDEEPLKIMFGDNQAVFELPGIRIISRLIEGQFPNYKQVIPQGCKTKIKVNTKLILEAAERASLLAKDGSNVVKLAASEKEMVISSSNPDIGKIEEQLPIELEGEEAQIAFNSKYLIDALRVIESEDILLELTGSLSPGVIKPLDEGDSYIYLILPIRVV